MRFTHIALVGVMPIALGCSSIFNLTGLSMVDDPGLRPASFMGGTRYNTDLMKSSVGANHARAGADMLFSIVCDIALLPLTLPIAAIVGDHPFEGDPNASASRTDR